MMALTKPYIIILILRVVEMPNKSSTAEFSNDLTFAKIAIKEKNRYESKGYGLLVAILITTAFFYGGPIML